MTATHLRVPGILIASVFLACSLLVFAQGIVTGSISGTVEDPSSAVIVGATVTATQQSTNASFKTVSNNAGSFQIPGMPTGAYTVAVEAPGFVSINIQGVSVTSGGQTP